MSKLAALIPRTPSVSLAERSRSSIGALIGIFVTGFVSRLAIGESSALPALIAPMGASAVLLFAVPSSPLAQPWSILGGNVIAAVVGVCAAATTANPFTASAAAIGVAIAMMMTCRCVHPPSGAVALTAVLGGQTIHDLGFSYVLWPVGLNSLLLLGVAVVFNKLVGRSYPHRGLNATAARKADDLSTMSRVGFSSADLDVVLKEYDQLLEVDRDDLEAILRQAEIRSYRRRAGQATCATVMTRDVVAISPDAAIGDALELLRVHEIKALPVTDYSARIMGIVTQTDLLEKAVWARKGPRLAYRQRAHLSFSRGRAPKGSVEDIMTTRFESAQLDMPLADVVRIMSRTGLHHLTVVASDGKLVGMVSQSDLVLALLAEAAADEPYGKLRSAGANT